jgi:uncharacterized protein YndB with AHSA1/START domain
MAQDFIARAAIDIKVPTPEVWNALTDPLIIEQYMFGTHVASEWKEGAAVTWKGEWQGKAYEDKGVILKLEPQHMIQYSHFSPLSGLADTPESYHTVTIEVTNGRNYTHLALSQDKNPTEEERDHSQRNWVAMLGAMKRLLEK